MNMSTTRPCRWQPHAPTVFIVEPEPSTQAVLARLIQQAGLHAVVAATAEEFLARRRVIAAGCLLVEERLPGMNGLELQGHILDRKELPIVFMSHQGDVQASVRAMKAGAFDFLAKPLHEEALLRAVELAIERSIAGLEEARRIHGLLQCYGELSRREREVLRLVAAGRLNKQVGFALGISEITVKAHRGSMMRKMRAGSLAELIGMVADLPHEPDDCDAAPMPRTRSQRQACEGARVMRRA